MSDGEIEIDEYNVDEITACNLDEEEDPLEEIRNQDGPRIVKKQKKKRKKPCEVDLQAKVHASIILHTF